MADAAQVKEVIMDVGEEGEDLQVGGASTRRRRRVRRRRHTQKSGDAEVTTESGSAVAVDKIDSSTVVAVAAPASGAPAIKKSPAVVPAPKVIIAPPKKKLAKIVLIPKTKAHHAVARPQKTFKAKRVRLTIDNTAKTQKKRRMTLARVDAMTDEQLRETAVATKLSRIETVKKVPVDLLRQMLKDYYTMRGMFL